MLSRRNKLATYTYTYYTDSGTHNFHIVFDIEAMFAVDIFLKYLAFYRLRFCSVYSHLHLLVETQLKNATIPNSLQADNNIGTTRDFRCQHHEQTIHKMSKTIEKAENKVKQWILMKPPNFVHF